MAPEQPPYLVIFDSRLDGDELRGTVEYIEPEDYSKQLRVRWAVETCPEDFEAVGEGVACVYKKGGGFKKISISKDATVPSQGGSQYYWTEGLDKRQPWVMFVLTLPKGFTLAKAQPVPAGVKIFRDQLALYWVLKGDSDGRTKVTWGLDKLTADLKHELARINRMVVSAPMPENPVVKVEDAGSTHTVREHTAVNRNPWISGSFYLTAAVTTIVLLAFLSRTVEFWALPAVIVGGLLLVTVIGAFQLRNDDALKDESFVSLMIETLKRLPLLRGKKN